MADLDVTELLARHLAGGTDLQDAVGRLAGDDNRLASVAQLLAQREQQLQAELAEQEQEHGREHEQSSLVARLDEAVAEIEALRALLADVGRALGACPGCLGEDAACGWCRGRGRPGSVPPDPESFERMVLPGIRLHARLGGRRTTTAGDEAPTERKAS